MLNSVAPALRYDASWAPLRLGIAVGPALALVPDVPANRGNTRYELGLSGESFVDVLWPHGRIGLRFSLLILRSLNNVSADAATATLIFDL